LAKKSVTLNGYEKFLAAIRDYKKQGIEREAAITQAVKDCISRNILKKFLETNSSEVRNMLLTEWNTADAMRVQGKFQEYLIYWALSLKHRFGVLATISE